LVFRLDSALAGAPGGELGIGHHILTGTAPGWAIPIRILIDIKSDSKALTSSQTQKPKLDQIEN
jgi:hypothetical protein